MSLMRLGNFEVVDNKGFKVFQKKGDKLFPEFYSFEDNRFIANNVKEKDIIKFEHWYQSKKYVDDEVGFYDGRIYHPGFHIFLKLNDAIEWIKMDRFNTTRKAIAQVKFTDIVARGYQYDLKTVVANQLKVIEEVNYKK